MTNTTASTTIIIPGRETQVIPGLALSKSDIIASFAGDIDLGRMVATETREGANVTIEFTNRTGTKGSDVHINTLNVQVDGDLVINATRIEIPGREAQVIPGLALSKSDVIASFAGDVDLAGMECNESIEEGTQVLAFSNRTGTKGQTNIMDAVFAAMRDTQAPQEVCSDEVEEEEGTPVLNSTRIVIPGREDQIIRGIVLDAQMVKESFAGELDLSGYQVEERESGSMLEVIFSARTGTKGVPNSK